MTEDFLHYLWKNKLFDASDLRTTSGELLRIVAPGFHNFDAGPDFRQAVVQIGDITWAGDVEIHIRSSDWFRHHHEKDEKYKSVAPLVCNKTLLLRQFLQKNREKPKQSEVSELCLDVTMDLIADNSTSSNFSHHQLSLADFAYLNVQTTSAPSFRNRAGA